MRTESVRFRPRQGEKDQKGSSGQYLQARLTSWAERLQRVIPQYTTHVAIVVLAILVFSVGPMALPFEYTLPIRATPTTAPSLGLRGFQPPVSGRGGPREDQVAQEPVVQASSIQPTADVRSLMLNALFHSPVVHTTIPNRLRREVITYVVQKGDIVLDLAIRFDLEEDTLIWANPALEQNPNLLRPGQELIVLPIDGVYHTVVKNDTLASVAKKYQASIADIVQCTYNNLDPENPQLVVDSKLIVPGGVKPVISRQVTMYSGPIPADAERGTGVFAWPCNGKLTDRFGFRTLSGRWHSGLDISGYKGADVAAADSGFVVYAGWTKTGYGNLVVIDHRNGFETYYAHLSTVLVAAGQSVKKGQLIATMGSTGNSTGPHLHVEIREKGVRKDPELYLP